MNCEWLRPWLELRAIRGMGDATRYRLLQGFGSPETVLTASHDALKEVGGLTADQVALVRRKPDAEAQRAIDRELKEIKRTGTSVITLLDENYPARLKTIPDPPLFLYVSGSLVASDHQALALVGSRHATPSGLLLTERLARDLASVGFTIVSGLARGVDASAHRGALAGGGRTLAVLGCGIDRTYPPEHKNLRFHIEEHGAVLSELPLGAYPHAYHFPKRNRIIGGLTLGVLVTEAAAKSGSLITARLAVEQGREVFAVPGPVGAEQSRGPHGLIKQGAKLVETVQDIVEELLPQLDNSVKQRLAQNFSLQPDAGPRLKDHEEIVYKLLTNDPIPIDDLIVKSGFPAGTVTSILLSMELRGLVRRLPGHCSVRVS